VYGVPVGWESSLGNNNGPSAKKAMVGLVWESRESLERWDEMGREERREEGEKR
jgi:hypothetical protein